MTRTFLKKQLAQKNVSGEKQRYKQTQAVPKETQQLSNFTQQPFNFHKKEKVMAYTTTCSKLTCIRGNRRETRVYM